MKIARRALRLACVIAIPLAILLVVLPLAEAQVEPVTWTRLSSTTGDLPVPPISDGQSGLRVVDLDQNGQNDYIITLWSAAETVIWYRHLGDTFEKYVIDTETPNLSHGEKFKDIDGDGDIDLLFGDAGLGNNIYWWENPYPNYDPDTPWIRRLVRDTGGNFYHDNIWGDFDGDGTDELIAWNQYGRQLLLFEIPADPKNSGPWPVTQIFSWTGATTKYRGTDAADINLDGKIDFVGGGGWFEHTGGTNFTFHPIDSAMEYSQTKAGQLIQGGNPEVVCVLERTAGPLNMYEWTGSEWQTHTLLSYVPRSHTLQLGDVNSDGYLDIMTGELGQWSPMGAPPDNPDAKISVLYGDGNGNFTQQVVFEGQGDLEGQLADIDNDGDLDIVAKPFRHNIPRVDIWINHGFTPSIIPNGGTFTGQVTVSMSASGGDAIYYTTDGSMPSTDSLLYTGPFTINTTSTVTAVSVRDGIIISDASSANFVIEPDLIAPSILSVYAVADPTRVRIFFSEAVEQSSAEAAANYSIDQGIAVYSASLDANLSTVILTTSPLLENISYTLTVNNVADRSLPANVIAPDSQVEFSYYSIPIQDFEGYAAGEDPDDWLDTGANSSLLANDSLFEVFDLNGGKAFGTQSTATNIHSHYVNEGIDILSGYEYTGRMTITDSGSGIGVTFFSHYPIADAYYRLRRYASNPSFHLAPHGTSVNGDKDTGVVPLPNQWYRFRIQVEDTGPQTVIRARVWLETESEPVEWLINAYDDSPNRLTGGIIGLWSMGAGAKYWDDLTVYMVGSPPVMVDVPDVVGSSQANAEAAIVVADLSVGTITTANSDIVPAGNVISQDPVAGTSVPSGSAVDIVVSLGPLEMVDVPDVVGFSQADAEAAIVVADLSVGTITTANSDTVPAGDVISQDPIAGTAVPSGSAVDLVASVGPLEMVNVPDVVGSSQADAEAAIVAVGLNVGNITTANSDTVPAGDVISQDPSAGTAVPSGSAVDLHVSLGPLEMVDVPDVVGASQADAEAAIGVAGLSVGTITTANSDTVPAEDVISQDPIAGTAVPNGSAVDLVVSLGPLEMVDVPDVVGASQADAEAAIGVAGLSVGTITTANSDTVPAGDVISQDPVAGTAVPSGSAVDIVVSSGTAAYQQDFEGYAAGEDPTDWLDTGANSSLLENDSLFKVFDLSGEKAFGTPSTATNIHSHYVGGGIDALSGYEYTGRMMVTASGSGIGVTFFSEYPLADAYYRLRRYANKPAFHLSSHGTSVSGDKDTGVIPVANVWYQFRIQVEDTGTQTEIRAKVWPEGDSEPVDWQAQANDVSPTRLTAGTIGLWSMGSGNKYWDDLTAYALGSPPEMVDVPDVVGSSQANAEAAIGAAGLSVGTITTANSDTVPEGDVISQDPAAGTSVPVGSAVDIVVSLGPLDMVDVPDVVGFSQANAEAAIAAAGLSVGTITTANSDTVPAGDVISQDPIAGTSVPIGSAVDLVVSLGPLEMVDVPDVVGSSQADAEAAIVAAGLNMGAVTTANSETVPAGDVISQDPVAGASVPSGSAVDLVVSSGTAAYQQDFEGYAAGEDPVDWMDTGSNNSLLANDSLFKVFDLSGEKAFGTPSTATNIHSHYVGGGINALSGYEYTGRMMITASGGGIGVTFFSEYPLADAYYRLRRYANKPAFHLSSHGTSVSGDKDTGVIPVANVWYQFRIQVEDTGTQTEIRAKVWPEGESEPVDWQAQANDVSPTRLTAGTIGLWSMGSSNKYWDDIAVVSLLP